MLATQVDFEAELERVVRGETPTVNPSVLLFVAAEVILEGRRADDRDFEHLRRACIPAGNLIVFPKG
jgi:hypothetical protein